MYRRGMVTSTAFISAKLPRAALTDSSSIQATTSLSNNRAAQRPPDFFPETKSLRSALRCRPGIDASGVCNLDRKARRDCARDRARYLKQGRSIRDCAARTPRGASSFRYNLRLLPVTLPLPADGSRQEFGTCRHRGEVVPVLGIARSLQAVDEKRRAGVLHSAASAQRNRNAAHGARISAHADGRADPLSPHARRQYLVAGRNRSRRNRDPDRRRKSAQGGGNIAPRAGP